MFYCILYRSRPSRWERPGGTRVFVKKWRQANTEDITGDNFSTCQQQKNAGETTTPGVFSKTTHFSKESNCPAARQACRLETKRSSLRCLLLTTEVRSFISRRSTQGASCVVEVVLKFTWYVFFGIGSGEELPCRGSGVRISNHVWTVSRREKSAPQKRTCGL